MAPSRGAADTPPVTAVYVTSSEPASGPGSDKEALDDAAGELRNAIGRKKGLRVVAAADVRVEVTNREQRDAGPGGFGGIKLTPLGEMIIRFHVKLTHPPPAAESGAETEADLKGIGQGYWSAAARDGATRLSKWIADHRRSTVVHR